MGIRMSRRVWAAAAVVVGLGIAFFLLPSHKVIDRPMEQSFEGRWTLDPASLPSVKNRTGALPANAQLLFAPEGRLTVKDMPYEEMPGSKQAFTLLNGNGRWRLERQQDWVVTVSFDDRRVDTLNIVLKDGKPATLFNSVTSPDSNEDWIWHKAP